MDQSVQAALRETSPQLADYSRKRDRVVQTIVESNRSWKDKYKHLLLNLESKDPRKVELAKNTLMIMENQRMFMEKVRGNPVLESTFKTALNTLVPKVVDLVRIFYPNLVANVLVDIQPMDRQNGEVFIVKPIYSTSAGGRTAGDQVFVNDTDGTYASEEVVLALGTGNGTLTAFTATFGSTRLPIRPGTFVVTAGAVTGTDDGKGNITGTGIAAASTINYTTGAVTVNFSAAPAASVAVTGDALYDSESDPSGIAELEIQLGLFPVSAKPHPLRVTWSQQAQLAAAAHLDLDIPDILTNLAASFIKKERDTKLINQIIATANHDTTLDFDATPPTNYSRLAKYAEIGVKLNEAENIIQAAQGRGGVSWVLCGNNASAVWRHADGFEPADVVAPIGPHVIGHLRDGTVAVVKVPSMNTNTYIIGFKGYVLGDAACILAEWIPLYASPTFESPDLISKKGMMSLYELYMNNTTYYRKGVLSGYAA